MKYLRVVFVFCAAIILAVSCNDKSTNTTEKEVIATLYQLPGCPSHSSSLNKVSTWDDSCFTYTFADTLKINFCLEGNCSPNHDRFKLTYNISNDTIYVAAADTAEEIANCFCPFTLYAEFENLPLEHYVFNVSYSKKGFSQIFTFYNENIYKNDR
jgi:hypothetical protein